MRVFKERQSTDNYTGCTLSGKMNYAYFPVYKNEIIPMGLPLTSHRLKSLSERALSMLTSSVGKFLLDDLQSYSDSTGIEISKMDKYCASLAFYIKGELQLDFDFCLGSPAILPELTRPNALLNGLIYILSNLADQQNFRIEYICFGDNTYLTVFYGLKHLSWEYGGWYDASVGISFDTPDRFKTMENERMLVYAKFGVELLGSSWKSFVNAYIMSGQIVNTGAKVFVFRGQDDGSVGFYEFNGVDEFRFAGPRQVPFLNSSDLVKIIGNNQKEVIA